MDLRFGGAHVLRDVSLEVYPGEIMALIGPNGAGKTSLVNVLTKVYRPNRGEVRLSIDGKVYTLSQMRAHELVRIGVARTYQNLLLQPAMSALDNVLMGRHPLMRAGTWSNLVWIGRASREDRLHREICLEILTFLGLGQYAHVVVGQLPYGIQKRIEIARALATRPRLLLLDEPAAGLNEAETVEIVELLQRIRASGRCTQLLIDHDMSLVMAVSERIAVLNFGEMIEVGAVKDVISNPEVIAAYLGTTSEQPAPTPPGTDEHRSDGRSGRLPLRSSQ
ncbi:ABC transporter ATP-binding protein [Pseudonocardia sp. GCM10023141]|uniref:ABC transporter ATP-binding protein n=1 Tax=Pseudonocardia sp. GCM10023141 TaxID=3252653 RepID=UPI00361EE2DF